MPQDANNIYVGARYVPLLLGSWDASVQYQPLSAVIYTDGNGYVSKRLVPAGTLPTDTDYWLLWGSGSVVIDQLSNRVGAVETRLDGLEARVTTNEGNITNIQAELLAHDSRLSFLQNVSTQLSSTLETLIKTSGKIVAVSTYGKTTGQEITSGSSITVNWERVRAQNIYDANISITNNNGVFTFNAPDPTKKYSLLVSANITWSKPGSVIDRRGLTLRDGTTDIVTVYCTDDMRNINLTNFYFGDISASTSLSILFRGIPSDAISFSDPGDGNFVTFTLLENQST